MQSVELENHELPYAINEELKVLRTNLQFCGADKQVVLLTSAFGGEGKSTVSLYLSRSLAELGKKVLLVDADMRKSMLSGKVVKGKLQVGLSHFLSGQCSANDVLYQTEVPGMKVIGAGSVPPNPAELLAGRTFEGLLGASRNLFDYIIVDCPPLGMVVDAAVIAPYCDGALLVLEAGRVHYKVAKDTVTRLRNTHCPVLGVVLNKVGRHKGGKYYGGYGKYGYGRYGYGKSGYGKYGYGDSQKKKK